MTKPASEKTTWLRMESSETNNGLIMDAIALYRAVKPGGLSEPSNCLAEICREWSDRERERIRRPEA